MRKVSTSQNRRNQTMIRGATNPSQMMMMTQTDYAILEKFHEEVYYGKRIHTDGEIKTVHAAWWRLADHYREKQEAPPLEIFLTLMYTMKYLPQTYEDKDGQSSRERN
jgi:hypothetical protein